MSATTAGWRPTEAHDKAMARNTRQHEQAVLGAMMLAPPGAAEPADIRELLTAPEGIKGVGEHHFTLPGHQLIWTTIVGLMDRNEPFDWLSVAHAIPVDQLDRIGGVPYLHTCIEMVPTVANGPYYARTVANATVLRDIGEASTAIAQHAAGTALHTEFVEDTLDSARTRLERIAMPGRRDAMIQWDPLAVATLEEMERVEQVANDPALQSLSEFSTPWPDLNQMLGPIGPGSLVLIAGRPGMAKSTAARDIFIHMALRHRIPSIFYSLEMSKLEIGMAIIANIAKVPLAAIKNGTVSDDDWTEIGRKLGHMKASPAEIDDTPKMNRAYRHRSLNTFRRKYHRYPAAYFYDYLQLGEEKGYGTRQEEVSVMSRGHKLDAKEYGSVAVVLSQLNRGPEQRADKLPQLSDLRESGSLEQDADVVLLLHRDDYYDPESPRAGELDIIVAKNRSGPTGTVTVGAQLHLSRLVSWSAS